MAKTKFLKRKIVALDPLKTRDVNSLVTALRDCSFQGRSLAYALDVWESMCRDKKCLRVISLAGAMVPAGMGLIVVRLIEAGLLDAIVCTGATLSHDLCNIVAQDDQAHYLGDEFSDDLALRNAEINRIYDTYLSERSFEAAERVLLTLAMALKITNKEGRTGITTTEFCRKIGARLKGRGILTAAARHDVKIFVPAISDSELGLNIAYANQKKLFGKNRSMEFDTLSDVTAFSEMILTKSKAGLVSIGGGVPRNWAQQAYPFLNMKLRDNRAKSEGYHYGVRITTDRPEFGGLSGCTISESKSWGKYETRAVEASVICDATIALPVLASALFQRLEAGKRPARKSR